MRIADRDITVYGRENAGTPLVVLNTFMGDGHEVWEECLDMETRPFSMVVIGGLKWDDDMTPWPCPPLSKKDSPCGGKADDYLKILTGEIIPAALDELGVGEPEYMAIAGYSLAGLFAVYSDYKTNIFSRTASASGSMWFPDFVDFVQENDMLRRQDKIYFSLGSREAKTRNKVLRTVEKNTAAIEKHFESLGVPAVFEINPGNHYKNPDRRMARGIKWMLD